MSTTTSNATLTIQVKRWRGSQNPGLLILSKLMEAEGMRPYRWQEGPNFRSPARTHGYDKVLYCVQGSIEINFPDEFERYTLRAGDRVEIPKGVRYAQTVGAEGVMCIEARRDARISLN
jgi:mannose-6-phosphate isomerase-like protein (cupin superfamily)